MSLAEDQAVPVRLRRAQRTLERLFKIASENDTGQARRVADFLLSGHKAAENGGWDPVALWNVDEAMAEDMVLVLRWIHVCHCYPDQLGFGKHIKTVWQTWRWASRAGSSESWGSTKERRNDGNEND
jgi:hypothetical protein